MSNRKYYKSNYVDVLKIITPDVYLDSDLAVSAYGLDVCDDLINSHIIAAKNIASNLNISAIPATDYSSIGNISGISRFFVKQNNLTDITTRKFYEKILQPLGVKLSDFGTKEEFKTYLSSILLPNIVLNATSLESTTNQKYGTTASSTHVYLIKNLNWLYFLNTSAPAGAGYSPSSLVLSALTEKIYFGKPYRINDAIKDYQTYLWKNYQGLSSLDSNIIPSKYLSGTGSFTSGVQSLEKLHTLIDVEYSPLYTERNNEKVKDAFETYFSATAYLSGTIPEGPFHKFLRGVSLGMFDVNDQIEGISQLPALENCPEDLLPYLANLIGWTLYGNNAESWRRQIRQASRLYKKRGTKSGLVDALNAVIINNPIQTSALVVELYESYLPNLLYYLLKTESPLFTPENYTQVLANNFGISVDVSEDMDVNVRAAVDNILLNTVVEFPELFVLKNEPFRVNITDSGKAWFGEVHQMPNGNWMTGTKHEDDEEYLSLLGDPAFTFSFRGREYGIPPWEEEKFYKNCVVTDNLLSFIGEELKKYCVSTELVNSFKTYTASYTTSGSLSNLYLNNGFLFFTSSLQLPPNYDSIISNAEREDYDYLSLWNGKASTFDFTVCAGSFSDDLFGDTSSIHTKEEVLDSLRIVDDFTPAKAIAAVKVILGRSENLSGVDSACNSIRYAFKDLNLSGGLANPTVSGVNVRGTEYARGRDFYAGFDDSRSFVSHADLPTFSRSQAKYAKGIPNSVVNVSSVVPSAVSGVFPRKSIRRRSFHNLVRGAGWSSRTGYNMPIYYNSVSSFSHNYYPLGLIPSSLSFAAATDNNISGVYGGCESSSSPNSYFGIQVNNTFGARGNRGLSFSSCHNYRGRDQTPEVVSLFHSINEKKKLLRAKAIVDYNKSILTASSAWMNLDRSIANMLPDEGMEKYFSPTLDSKTVGSHIFGGIYSVYNEYLTKLLSHSLPENLAVKYTQGGRNILSHVYGPIFFNASLQVDGSALDTSSQLITSSLEREYKINLAKEGTDLIDTALITETSQLYFGGHEYANNQILSGLTFYDGTTNLTPQNEFVVYDLSEEEAQINSDNYVINNKLISMKSKSHGLPRIRFGLRSTGEKNILLPEHDFELKIRGLTGKEKQSSIGGGKFGVLIHTKYELAKNGKSVMFVWSPREKWEMVELSTLQSGASSIATILKDYAHIFEDSEIQDLEGNYPYCETYSEKTRVLKRIQETNFREFSLKFNTNNNLVDPPFDYKTYFNGALPSVYNGRFVQLHRASVENKHISQNYFVNVFAIPSQDETDFFLLDDISLVDSTLNEAAKISHTYSIPDYKAFDKGYHHNAFVNPNGATTKGATSEYLTESTEPQDLVGAPKEVQDQSLQFQMDMETGTMAYDAAYGSLGGPGYWPYTGPKNEPWFGYLFGPDRAVYSRTGFGGPTPTNPAWMGSQFHEHITSYFMSRGASQTEADHATGGFCSFDRWCDTMFYNKGYVYTNSDLSKTRWPLYNSTRLFTAYTHGDKADSAGFGTSLGFGWKLTHNFSHCVALGQSIGADVNPLGFSRDDDALLTFNNLPFGIEWAGGPSQVTFLTQRTSRPDDFTEEVPVLQQDMFLDEILDPTGIVPSALMFNTANTEGLKLDHYWQGNEVDGIKLFDGRHFPPNSLYQDVRKEDLNDETYTFSVYVNATKPDGTILEPVTRDRATSAIVTLGPIDSASYTRLTLNFDDESTKILKSGHTLADSVAAKVEKIVTPPGGGSTWNSPASGVTWFRVSVTFPYSPTELDRLNYENLGLRCCIQGYNNREDGNQPDTYQTPNNEIEPAALFTKSIMGMWGAALHRGLVAQPWERYTIEDYDTLWANIPPKDVTVYRSLNNLIVTEVSYAEKRVFRDNAGRCFTYNASLSGLDKLTYVNRVSQLPGNSPVTTYVSVSAEDSSGVMYDGDIFINAAGDILREKRRGVTETVADRRLQTSGVIGGTNVVKTLKDAIILEPRELLHLFRYFNSIGQVKQLKATDVMFSSVTTTPNSRSAYYSSGVNDVSGGSRINYRVNPATLQGQNKAIVQDIYKNYSSLSALN